MNPGNRGNRAIRGARFRAALSLRIALGVATFTATTAIAPIVIAAESAEAELAAAEAAFAQLAYEDASKKAEGVIKAGSLKHDQLVRAYRLVALSRASMDQGDKAREAFVQLLTYDPEFKLDASHGPKIKQPYIEASGFLRGQPAKPGMEVSPLLREGEPGTLRLIVRDPTRVVKNVVLAWRWGTAANFRRVDATVGDQVVTVPAPPERITRLDYYAQAFDAQGNAVFELGNESVPKTALVEAGSRASGGAAARAGQKQERGGGGGGVLSSPVFWIVAGVVVVGAATGAIVLATRSSDTREETLPPTNANLGPILFCGADRCR